MTADISDFQRSSTIQGQAFEDAALALFRAEGWTIIGTKQRPHPDYPEIDIVAEDPLGTLWWIESKGSWGNSPGLIRGDTVKKAVAVADDLMTLRRDYSQDGDTPVPYMLVTSHAPHLDTLGVKMLRRAIQRGSINQIRVLALVEWKP